MKSIHDFAGQLIQLLELDPRICATSDDTQLFDQWGLDSLQAFQLVVAIESMAGALVPPPIVPEMYTVGEAYRYFLSLFPGRGLV
jgi:acyl carrier protein